MHEVNILRVTAELRQLVQDCATHCGVAVSDVLRCSAAGIRSGRLVTQKEIADCMTNAGNFRLPVRGMMLPEGYPLAEFRRVLALRCMEELAKPKKAQPVFQLREGVDYILVHDEEY
jgi:hypothetical protein